MLLNEDTVQHRSAESKVKSPLDLPYGHTWQRLKTPHEEGSADRFALCLEDQRALRRFRVSRETDLDRAETYAPIFFAMHLAGRRDCKPRGGRCELAALWISLSACCVPYRQVRARREKNEFYCCCLIYKRTSRAFWQGWRATFCRSPCAASELTHGYVRD